MILSCIQDSRSFQQRCVGMDSSTITESSVAKKDALPWLVSIEGYTVTLSLPVILLMEEILHHLGCINLVNNGISYLSTGAGIQPSTVPHQVGLVFWVVVFSGSKYLQKFQGVWDSPREFGLTFWFPMETDTLMITALHLNEKLGILKKMKDNSSRVYLKLLGGYSDLVP